MIPWQKEPVKKESSCEQIRHGEIGSLEVCFPVGVGIFGILAEQLLIYGVLSLSLEPDAQFPPENDR